MASLTEAKFLCYLGRSPSIPGNEKSGGIHLDNPHFTMWLHLSMLIDIQMPLINQDRKPRGAIYGEIIDINSLPICPPLECDLQAVCAALERKLLPPEHPANNELAYNLKLKKLYYKSIGGITEGSACRRPFRIVPYTCTFVQYLRTFVPYDGTYGAPD